MEKSVAESPDSFSASPQRGLGLEAQDASGRMRKMSDEPGDSTHPCRMLDC